MNWNQDELRRLVLIDGLTHKQIGARYGCSAAAVAYHCAAWHIAKPVQERTRATTRLLVDFDDVAQRLAAGATLTQVAADLRCDRHALSHACRLHGIAPPRRGPRGGERHPKWAGGIVIRDGYRYRWSPDHPNATKSGYVLEHRLVMECLLGRLLTPAEVVHHRDGCRANNEPENLEVFATNADHLRHELTGRCPQWSEDGRARILAATRRPRTTRQTRQVPDAPPSP